MVRLKFNAIFIPLVFLSGASAFISPSGAGQSVRGQVETLFTPVSYPVRQLAGEVTRTIDRSQGREFGEVVIGGDLVEENRQLQNLVASLTSQLEALKTLNAGREIRGDARKYAIPVKVSGSDSSGRQILSLKGGSSLNIAAGQPVVRNDAMIGRVLSVSSGSSSVRLITDKASRVLGQFGRMNETPDGRMEFLPIRGLNPLVEGKGDGRMMISNLTMQQVKEYGLQAGDYVVLRDVDDWPLVVNGFIMGMIDRIEPQAKAPLHAQISVRPRINLAQLTEVMVVQLPDETPSVKPNTASKAK